MSISIDVYLAALAKIPDQDLARIFNLRTESDLINEYKLGKKERERELMFQKSEGW